MWEQRPSFLGSGPPEEEFGQRIKAQLQPTPGSRGLASSYGRLSKLLKQCACIAAGNGEDGHCDSTDPKGPQMRTLTSSVIHCRLSHCQQMVFRGTRVANSQG